MIRKDLLNALQNELRREKQFESKRKEIISKYDEDLYNNTVESTRYVQAYKEFTERFIPKVRVRHPETFTFYGSAEKYYDSAFKYIHTSYPYDGSGLEKLQWSLSASALDLAILQHEYPKETGFVTFTPLSWGSVSATSGRYSLSDDPEYIKFFGGPYVNSKFDSETKRESSLKIDGSGGNTLEFWMRKDSFVSSLTSTEVIFDSHTINNAEGTSGYGRFLLELSSSSGSPFYLTYMSGTAGMDRVQLGSSVTDSTVADGQWHHYAFAINHVSSSTSQSLVTDMYIDGEHNSTTKTSTATFGAVKDYFKGTIGALATQKNSSGGLGYGKLSGSLDEIRFWKTKRTAKDIGNYFDFPVNGATDSETINSVLGIYYKFNEGTISNTTQDKIILDYSGRLNNGEFVGYGSDNRNSGSAISLSTASGETELGDPIINPNSSRVVSALAELVQIGKEYDELNNSSIFKSVPQWAYEPSAGSNNLDSDFSILLQAIASRFDSIKILIDQIPQIARKKYDDFHFAKGSIEYHPSLYVLLGCEREFVQKFASFGNVEVFSYNNLLARNFDVKELPIINKLSLDEYFYNLKFSQTDEINNLGSFINLSKGKQVSDKILNSIYYDIDAIYKKKGTQSAFRNLIRCFGVDEKLVTPNVYINNGEVLLKDNPIYEDVVIKSLEVLNKNNSTTLFQTSSTSQERHYIQGKNSGSMSFEVRSVFPDTSAYTTEHTETSIFGLNEVLNSSIQVANPNQAAFTVTSVKDDRAFKGSRFKLSSSSGLFSEITSNYFPEVFDNTPWHLSVRFSEDTGVKLANLNTKTTKSYKVEFSGHYYELDTLVSSFNLSSSITQTNYLNFIQANKSVFAGAQRASITGSVEKVSENRFLSLTVWDDRLSDAEIKEHAKSTDNIGRFMAFSETDDNDDSSRVKIDTLILNWQFDDTTTSGTKINVVDHASGSLDKISHHGNILGYKYPGVTIGVANTTSIIDTEHLYHIKYMPIDNAVGESKIQIKDREIDLFEIDSRPISYIYSYEKSAYQVMSRQMLRMIAGVSAFNNLIGEPIYKYRERYKSLDNIREKFFARIENDVDLERFIEYYKWVDSSLSRMLEQLQPATSEMKLGLQDVIESHSFERNKYKHQAPVFEFKEPNLNTNILGINELLYDWKRGNAGPATAATATITFTGTVADQPEALIITSVDADGTRTTKTYLAAGGNDAANGQFVREGGIAATAAGLKAAIEHSVRGHGNKIIVSVNGGVVTLTQATKGKAGNVAIGGTLNSDGNASVSGFSGGIGLDQAENCLWWQDRAERDGILSVPGAPNTDRETLKTRANTFVEGSTYVIRKLSRPYRFAVERSNIISLGSNRNANKNKDLYKVIHSGKEITLNKSDIYEFKNCDDVINPQEEDIYTAKVDVDGTSGYLDADADMLLPFSLYSSSVGSDFSNFKDNLSITNNHDDQMPSLQGPFVRENVGGMPHRRVRYLTPDQDRAEAYIISASATTLTVKQPTGLKSIISRGRENYTNISNIKTDRDSTPVVIGNYDKVYEIVQAHGRSKNNRFLADSGSISIDPIVNGRIFGSIDYAIPVRQKSEHVFVNRFSAPGGPETMAHGAKDLESGEFSIYNSMNYRNLSVRDPLNRLHSERSEKLGYRSGSTTQASVHMTNRNYQYSVTSGSYGEQKEPDNFYIQHPIPQNDMQYAWITASSDTTALGFVEANAGFGHQHSFTTGSKSAIEFVSSSTYQNPILNGQFYGSSDTLFGWDVSIFKDRAYISEPNRAVNSRSLNGAVDIYENLGGSWYLETTLTGSSSLDRFGQSIDATDDVLCVGAIGGGTNGGELFIFERRGENPWTAAAVVTSSAQSPAPGSNDLFGTSVSISGDNVIVGAPAYNSNSGYASIFNRKLGWLNTAHLTSSTGLAATHRFGTSVNIQGSTAVVGAWYGRYAEVFVETGENNWEFLQRLTPATGGSSNDYYGFSVTISDSEDIIVVGAPYNDVAATNAGAAYIYEKSGSTYVQTQVLYGDSENDVFAYGRIQVKDGFLFIGQVEVTSTSGAVMIYQKIRGKWTKIKTLRHKHYQLNNDANNQDYFGLNLDVHKGLIIAGAPLSSVGGGGAGAGSAYIFKKMGKSWADVDINYAGVNLSIVDGVDEDTNTLAKITDATAGQLINHRQGPYGWPTWKQIRGYEHPVARAHKKSNTFSRVYMGKPRKLDNFNKKAVTFNGTDSYFQINSTRTIFAGDQFSVFTWIKHPEITRHAGHALWGVNSAAGANRISLFLQGTASSHNDGVISLFVTGEGHQKWSYIRRDDNEWHQIGIVYEKLSDATATIELYVDGVSQGDKIDVQPFNLTEGDELISIGAEWETSAGGTPSHFNNGQMADFIIWDQALTDTQAANLVKYSGLDHRSKGPIDINSRDDIPAAAVWYRMGDGTEFPDGRKDKITLTAGSEEHNIIFNNQSELYNATPVGTSMAIEDVSSVLPGDHFILTPQTIIPGSQDASMNVGYSLGFDSSDDPYERARNLDSSSIGDNSPGTYDNIRVIKNYDESPVTVKYSPISVTLHGDQSYTAPILNGFLGNWERGFDPRLPRFFMKRENVQKLNQLDRERSWNLDNKYYESITNDIILSEREELGDIGKYSISYGQVNLKKTFGNDIVTFANEQILRDTLAKETITSEAISFLDLLIDENDAEHNKLIEVSYIESLYPREVNTFSKNARARFNFDFFGWKASRSDRETILVGNIEHKPDEPLLVDSGVSAFPKTISKNKKDYRKSFLGLFDAIDVSSYSISNVGITSHITASSWVLDSRKDLTTYPTNITSSFINQSSSFLAIRDQGTRGEGLLQNDFSIFPLGYNGLYATPPFSLTYNRRIPQLSGSDVYLAGEAKWEAASGNLGPFYNSYADYSYNDLRLIAKDHSIVPEFRMSEFVEEVLNGVRPYPDRRALENPLSYWPDFLSLTGSIHTDEEGNLEISGKSYKTYSNSDFLKYFKVVDDELMNGEQPITPTRLTLKCKAAMKFLPYRGFYPAERVAQIHELFHKNYLSDDVLQKARLRADAPETEIQTRRYLNLRANASRYQVSKAFFGPGILMNSIKSGVAVDYPIFTGSFHDVRHNLPASSPLSGSWPEGGSRLVPTNTTFTGSLVNQTEDFGIPRIKSTTTRRINFEDLLNPSNIYGVEIFDNEPHPSASLQYGSQKWNRIIERPAKFGTLERNNLFSDLGVRFSNNKKDFANQIAPYTLAMQNFAAETVNFFLEDGHLTTAMSKPIDEPFVKDEIYKMRVRISNNNNVMYDRHSAFGPPVDDSGTGLDLTKLTVSTTPTPSTATLTFTDPNTYKADLLHYSGSRYTLPNFIIEAGNQNYVIVAFYRSSANFATQPADFLGDPGSAFLNIVTIDIDETIGQSDPAASTALLVAQKLNSSLLFDFTANLVATADGAVLTVATKNNGPTNQQEIGLGHPVHTDTDEDPVFLFSGSGTPNILVGRKEDSEFVQGSDGSTSYYTRSILPSTSSHGFAPYVPPFLDPNSDPYVEITFTPTAATGGSKNYTAQEIIDASTFEYYNFNEVPNNASTNTNYKESMSLSASLNLGICASFRTDNIETLAEGRAFISNEEDPSTLRYETDNKVDINKRLDRWVIQTKWETPVMDFSNVSASALNLATGQEQMVSGSPWKDRYWDSYYSVGAERAGVTSGIFMTGSTGMWHQKGEVLTNQANAGQKKGYYLVVEDAPTGLPLATKLGFINHIEENETVKSLKRAKDYRTRIGMVEDRKMIKEAVVAIPYVLREDLPDNSPNKVQFITLEQQLYQDARKNLQNIKRELTNIPLSDIITSIDEYRGFLQSYNEKTKNLISDSPLNAIEYQLMMMGDYILPPALDFRITGNAPFMMYFFQFRASLNQQDLSNIWQNLYPESATSMANARYSCADRQYEGRNGRMGDVSYVSHYLDTISLLDENYCPVNKPYDLFSPRNTKNKTRWLVFKVKERGKTSLEKIRHRSLDPRVNNINKFEYIKEGQSSTTFETLDIQRISNRVEAGLGNTLQFNWPYDYFSFVELIKLEAKIDSYTYKKIE